MKAVKGYYADGKLSASQLALWDSSKASYIKHYINGEERFETKYMRFGSELHEVLETGASQDETMHFLSQTLPKYREQELHLEAKTKIGKKDIVLHGYLDGYEDDKILDYKTGKGDWSVQDVADRLQFKFYSYLHLLVFGELPKEIRVIHIKTGETVDGRVYATGEVSEYVHVPTSQDVEDVKKVIAEFLDWTPEESIPAEFESDVQLLIELTQTQEQIKTQIDEIKSRIDAGLGMAGLDGIQDERINIYYSERKKYEYSEAILEAEKAVKQAKKEFEKTAEFEITKTLNVRIK